MGKRRGDCGAFMEHNCEYDDDEGPCLWAPVDVCLGPGVGSSTTRKTCVIINSQTCVCLPLTFRWAAFVDDDGRAVSDHLITDDAFQACSADSHLMIFHQKDNAKGETTKFPDESYSGQIALSVRLFYRRTQCFFHINIKGVRLFEQTKKNRRHSRLWARFTFLGRLSLS